MQVRLLPAVILFGCALFVSGDAPTLHAFNAPYVVAQSAPAITFAGTPPAFASASIKRNTVGGPLTGVGYLSPDGLVTATNMTVAQLVGYAYGVRDDETAGMPDWARMERFDVEGRTEYFGLSPYARSEQQRYQALMRTLLAERFRLAAHLERREVAASVLTTSATGAARGVKRIAADCAIPAVSRASCGFAASPGRMDGRGISMAQLAHHISNVMRGPVVDRTGLDGYYALTLSWTSGDRASLAAAIRDQLGLVLESRTMPLDVLVIDSVARPTLD